MARVERAWRAFRRLTWAQRSLLLRSWLLLPIVAIGLRLIGFQRVQAALLPPSATPPRIDLPAAEAIAYIVRAAAGWNPVRTSCLTRALVLCRHLRIDGLEAKLCIGVERPGGAFAAHAWVEHGNVPLAEPQDVSARYAVFDGRTLTRES